MFYPRAILPELASKKVTSSDGTRAGYLKASFGAGLSDK